MAHAALSRREQNKAEKRGRIIAAARALFAHKGFEATTTLEIAEAAGVAAGTLFLYAKTKDDLLILVFREEMTELVERAYDAAKHERALIDQLIAFFGTFVAYHERDLALARALMRQLGYVASGEQRAEVNELMTALLRRLAVLIEAAKGRGEARADTPLMGAAQAVFGIYYLNLGKLLSGFVNREQFDRDLKGQLALLLSGL
jgi:AcrR family transcriptional regulator